jgi:hypothetical protein
MLSGTTTYYSNDVEQVTDEDEEDAMIVQLDEASLHCFWKEGPHDLVFEVIEECSYDENGDYKH